MAKLIIKTSCGLGIDTFVKTFKNNKELFENKENIVNGLNGKIIKFLGRECKTIILSVTTQFESGKKFIEKF